MSSSIIVHSKSEMLVYVISVLKHSTKDFIFALDANRTIKTINAQCQRNGTEQQGAWESHKGFNQRIWPRIELGFDDYFVVAISLVYAEIQVLANIVIARFKSVWFESRLG